MSDTPTSHSPEGLLCHAIYNAHHDFTRFYRPLLTPMGLTYPQYLVMLALLEPEEPQSVGRLTARLGMETSTLSPLLKRLQAMGLIARTRSREDERQVLVTLTDAGRDIGPQVRAVPGCVADRLGLSAREVADAMRAVTRVRQALSAPDGPAEEQAEPTWDGPHQLS